MPGVKLPPIEQPAGSVPTLPTGSVVVRNADTGATVSVYNDRALTSLLSGTGATTVTQGKVTGYAASGVDVTYTVTPSNSSQSAQTTTAIPLVSSSVESGAVQPTGIADTNLVSWDAPNTTLKKLRRDWVDVDEFTGTDPQRILAAVGRAATDRKIVKFDESRTFTIDAQVDLTSALTSAGRPITLEIGAAKLNVTVSLNSQATLYAAGTVGAFTNLTVDVLEGAQTVTLPTGQGAAGGWARGQWIAVECLFGVYGVNASGVQWGYPREIKQVLSVSGDVLTVDSPFVYPHTVATSGRYQKVNTIAAPRIIGGEWTWTDPMANPGYALRFERCTDIDIDGYTVTDGGGSIQLIECLGGIVDAEIDKLPHYGVDVGDTGFPSFGYGVALTGSCRDLDVHLIGRGCRHIFTTLSNERTPATQGNVGGVSDPNSTNGNYFVGGPSGCQVSGTAEGDAKTPAVWDTHEFGENITFDVTAIGGNVGMQIRDRSAKGRAICRRQGLMGAYFFYSSRDCDMEVDISGVGGMGGAKGVGMSGIDNRVWGRVYDCAAPGVAMSLHSIDQPSMRHVIEIKGENNLNYGVQDQGAVAPLVIRSRLPKSGGTANTTSGSPTVTNLIGRFKRGEAITGAGIPASTTVKSISADGRTITLSANATATATGVALTGEQTVSVLNFGASAPAGTVGTIEDTDCYGYGASAGLTGLAATARVANVRTDSGIVGNQAYYLGTTGVVPNFDTLLYRGGFGQLRSDASIRSTKALQTATYNTTGLTSAQIDALITGTTISDGMFIADLTNNIMLVRLNGKWYKTAALTLIA